MRIPEEGKLTKNNGVHENKKRNKWTFKSVESHGNFQRQRVTKFSDTVLLLIKSIFNPVPSRKNGGVSEIKTENADMMVDINSIDSVLK